MAESANVKSEPYIKPDPEASESPAPPFADDEDLYEDAGDLEFFDPSQSGATYGSAYLVKLPKELWETWNKTPGETEVGTMRQWDVKKPDGTVDHRFRMLLNAPSAGGQLQPREYDLDMAPIGPDSTRSTFVFTEQDLEGFDSSKGQGNMNNGLPAFMNRQRQEKPQQKKKWDKNRRYTPYYRKAIPKKTKIAARIQYEMGCRPVDNEENRSILQFKQLEAHKPKHELKIVDHWQMNNVIAQGSAAAQAKFGSFVKTSQPVKPTKQKKPANKAIRMGEDELRQALLEAFTTRYQYWKISVLKATFNQPEAYLRQELEKVAVLNRSGPHSNEWELKPEFKQIIDSSKALAESAPDAIAEDDDEVEMEDVVPGN